MSDRSLAWGVGVVAFAILAPGAFFGLPHGKIVVGATRVLAGEVPYRDFWSMYAPGAFYLTAGLFALLGRELLVQGLAASALAAASAAVVFLLLRDAGAGRRLAVLGALVLAAASWHPEVELTSYEPALLLVLIALRAVLGDRLLLAGTLLGLAALFKHDVAGYAAIGSALALLLRRRNPLPMIACALAVVVPAAALLAWTAGADAWHDLVVFPATDFRAVRAEPYPHLFPPSAPLAAWMDRPGSLGALRGAALAIGRWLSCLGPELLFLAGLGVAARRRGDAAPALVLALCLLPFFWLAAHVQQNTHLHTMGVLAAVVVAATWRDRSLPRPALALAGGLYALGLLVVPAVGLARTAIELPGARLVGARGASLVSVADDVYRTVRPVVSYVTSNVPQEEPIYVGLLRHDATVISKPIYYFLCDRRPAVRYHELHPGVTDREDVQAEMLGWIEGRRVRCAILWRFGWPKERLDGIRDRCRRAIPGGGSTLLDEWIAQRFRPKGMFGEQIVCWRSD